MSKDDQIEMEGTVLETLPNTVFRVKLRAPGDVEYRRLSGDLIRPYLEARGFLATAGRAFQ